MITQKELYNEAKKIYKKRQSKAVMISLVAFLIKFAVYFAIITAQFLCAQFGGQQFMFGAPSAIFYVMYFAAFVFVHIPLNTGAGVCYSKIAMRHRVKVDEVFAYFKQLDKALRCQMPVVIKCGLATLGWYFVARIAGSILAVGGVSSTGSTWAFTMTVIVLCALASSWAIIIANSAITYVLAKVPEANARKTVRMAKNIMKYRTVDMFALYIRAIPQILLGIVTLGVWFIWAVPFLNILNKRFIRHFCD